ncbi:uncharacterized protein G2W53_013189 [Senna tora]|uniref:Uncharacterized protein n=1 Tax=Senna tora TaxID=362788 RepID=A0A834WS42_9FABA|nr:uncharacterized protein G2W53_013189 [Senna tora]
MEKVSHKDSRRYLEAEKKATTT